MTLFKVSVAKEYLSFSSAHFITLAGHQCESLHGHNYRVGVTVEGEVDPECGFVVDFGVLKRIVRPYVEAVDHRVILPTENPKLKLQQEPGDRLVVEYLGNRQFVFPRSNCALLPVTNTTAERIAEYLAGRIREDLAGQNLRLDAIEVEVEESPGQSGYCKVEGPGVRD